VPLLAEPPVDPAEEKKREVRKRELEMWGGVTGVILFAAAFAVIIVGIGAFTLFRDDPEAAARAARWNQCYNATGDKCVLDGGTIRVGMQRIAIAGIEAPLIQDARCEAERSKGIDAATRLADLLNSGNVTASAPFVDAGGRTVRRVKVNGEDVAGTLIDAGVARDPGDAPASWC
jgi:endonuclease YncB( thermonuclease family)